MCRVFSQRKRALWLWSETMATAGVLLVYFRVSTTRGHYAPGGAAAASLALAALAAARRVCPSHLCLSRRSLSPHRGSINDRSSPPPLPAVVALKRLLFLPSFPSPFFSFLHLEPGAPPRYMKYPPRDWCTEEPRSFSPAPETPRAARAAREERAEEPWQRPSCTPR